MSMDQQKKIEEMLAQAEETFKDLTDDQKMFMDRYQTNLTEICTVVARAMVGPQSNWSEGAAILGDLAQDIVDLVAQKTKGTLGIPGLITLMGMTIGNQLGLDAVRKRQHGSPNFKLDQALMEEAGMLFEAGIRSASFTTEQTAEGRLVFAVPKNRIIQ